MIEKPKRAKKIDAQDRQPPRTIDELMRRYDLDNNKVYDYLDKLVDVLNTEGSFIEDSGSNANGNYIKYKNGIMICYGSKTETLNITSSFEGEYFATTSNVNFPVSFVGVPTVIVTLTQNNSLLRYNNSNIYTDRFVGYISKLQSKSNVTLTLDFMAIGRWK